MSEEQKPEYPRSYKDQRLLERRAIKERDTTGKNGGKMPPVCGFTYMPRPNNRTKNTLKPTEVVCVRTAGAGTKHHGQGYCDYHEVQSILEMNKVSKKNGKAQIQAARNIAYQQAKFFGEPVNIGPHDALLAEVHRSAGIVAWLEAKLQRLKDDGTPEDDVLRQFTKMGVQPSVWMQLFREERQHLVQVSTAAIKAGVAERRVQLAEAQGRMIAALLMRFIHDPELGLTPQQIMEAPNVIRKHMLALPSTEVGVSGEEIYEAEVVNG